jgi:hypothetical protein
MKNNKLSKGRKIVCDVPREIINFMDDYILRKTDFTTLTAYYNCVFSFYINELFKVTPSDILRYEGMPGKTRNNFSFYLKDEHYYKLETLAVANLRSVKDQSLHYIYSVYKYLKVDQFKAPVLNFESE